MNNIILGINIFLVKQGIYCPPKLNVTEYRTKGQSKMNNPEKLATFGTQYKDKQNTTHIMLDITIRKQTHIT